MKNFVFILLVALGSSFFSTNIYAQGGQAVFPTRVNKVVTGGLFNSSTKAGGTATASTVSDKDYTVFPLYTKLDTVRNTGADTFYQAVKGNLDQVYIFAHVNSDSGTNTACTVRIQGSPDKMSGKSLSNDWITLQTYTVSATGNPYEFNSKKDGAGAGHTYEGYRVILTGSGTHRSSWYCGMNAK